MSELKGSLDAETITKAVAFLNADRKRGTEIKGFGGGVTSFCGSGCLVKYLDPSDRDRINACFGYQDITTESLQDKGATINIVLKGRYRVNGKPKVEVTAHVPKADFVTWST